MKAVIDIGDQKTGSKSRQAFLKRNRSELYRHNCYLLDSTKIGNYDMGLMAYAGRENPSNTFRKGKKISNEVDLDSFIENEIAKEVEALNCGKVFFSFEGLIHLKENEVKKVVSMLRRYFSEVFIIGFLRRQDRWAVSSYTTSLVNLGVKEMSLLHTPNGKPKGSDYFERFQRWSKLVPKENITFINYDECEDVSKSFAHAAGIPGNLSFESARHNTSMSAFGSEVLRRFNKDLSNKDEFKGREKEVRQAIRNFYVGSSLQPSKEEAAALFWRFSDSNKKLSEALCSEKEYFFDEAFSEYPDEFSPVDLSLDDVEESVKEALKES